MELFQPLFDTLQDSHLQPWLDTLPAQLSEIVDHNNHGDFERWQQVLLDLPEIVTSVVDLNQDALLIGHPDDCSDGVRQHLRHCLQQLHPWRKGPYLLHGIHIDTEWHSDWKWQRVAPHISNLTGRHVLDVGCGNGYHCWRMAGAGAKQVIGIDPSLFFMSQFRAIQRYAQQQDRVHMLPLGIEAMPQQGAQFDTVFSMGVLYHRRSPIDFILQLKQCLRSGGELVLETLVVDGPLGMALLPEQRYAKMRNVWFIPSMLTLEQWLRRCGFKQIQLVDVDQTSLQEQRSTEWMRFESLQDFLDPNDINRTVEGYPAPKRAVMVAQKP